jgi:hypothetical protein
LPHLAASGVSAERRFTTLRDLICMSLRVVEPCVAQSLDDPLDLIGIEVQRDLFQIRKGRRMECNDIQVAALDKAPKEFFAADLPPEWDDEVLVATPDACLCREGVLDHSLPANALN